MFNLSGSEIIFLVIIALVVLGPDKLPEAMRKAGKAYADFKKMTSGFQNEMKSVLDEPLRELRETADLAKKSAMWDMNGSPATKPVSGSMAAHEPTAPANEPPAAATNEPPAAAAAATSDETPATVHETDAAAEPVTPAVPPPTPAPVGAEPPPVTVVGGDEDTDEVASA